MNNINTDFLKKCIATLEMSYKLLKKSKKNSINYEMYRNSLVKAFEMTLEQSGKLLKKVLTPFFATKKEIDRLTFKDLFRNAAKRGLLTKEEVERWFIYRDNRNNTAHDYGEAFAENTLSLIDGFIKDAKKIKKTIENA